MSAERDMEDLLNEVFRNVVWNKYGWGRKEGKNDGKGKGSAAS